MPERRAPDGAIRYPEFIDAIPLGVLVVPVYLGTPSSLVLGEAGIGEHLGYTVITVSSSRALILHRDATGGAVSGLTFENNERVFGTISVNNDNKLRFIDGDGTRFIVNMTPE